MTPNSSTTTTTQPASLGPIRLDHACILTTDLHSALGFYLDVLGLGLERIEEDPLRPGHQRALLVDALGTEVLEIIEMAELSHQAIPGRGGLHHLGFRLPRRAWRDLRSRLDARSYDYQEISDRLFVRDADGLILEIEQTPHE